MPPRSRPTHCCLAVLDVGSNSVKLLLAGPAGRTFPGVMLEKSVITRLGEGIRHRYRLRETAMQRTLDAVLELKLAAERTSAIQWHAVATSAVRDAANRREFEKRFRKCAGFPLQVLSGKEEAERIYVGATSDVAPVSSHARFLVMDVGGGSAEWILGARSKMEKSLSLDLGCVRMTEHFLRGDPYTEDSWRNLLAYYREQLKPVHDGFAAVEPHGQGLGSLRRRVDLHLIGTGGSITTAAALDMALSSPHHPSIHGRVMTLQALETLVEKLRLMTQAERLKLGDLSPGRADIIAAGAALFVAAMRILGAEKITASLRGLRQGVLLRAMET